MASLNSDEVQHTSLAQQYHVASSEKPTDDNVTIEERADNDEQDTNTNQYTFICNLWSWISGTDTSISSTTFTSNPQSNNSYLGSTDEKTAHSSPPSHAQTLPPLSAQDAMERIIDEPREPGIKYKGSAPSRGTHRDYPPTRDALWTGGGNRAVPEGLRTAAGGSSHSGDEEEQQPCASGGGESSRDEDDGDRDEEEERGRADGKAERAEEERVPLKYKGVSNRRKPKHRPGVWPYRGGTTTWERWSLLFRGRVFSEDCDYGPDCTC